MTKLWLPWCLGLLLCLWLLDVSSSAVVRDESIYAPSQPLPQGVAIAQRPQAVRISRVILSYHPWQNTRFSLEKSSTGACNLYAVYLITPQDTPGLEKITDSPQCGYASRIDLAGRLRPGANEILIVADATEYVQMTPLILGGNMLSTLAGLGLGVLATLALLHLMARWQLEPAVRVMMAAAMAYFSFWLHYYPSTVQTADLVGHLAYTADMVRHWWRPYAYRGPEFFQPPTYYLLAAPLWRLGEAWGAVNTLVLLKLYSLAYYVFFLLYALRILADSFAHRNIVYYLACALLLFWPLNAVIGLRINNDIASYPFWAAMLFYLGRWLRAGEAAALRHSAYALALGFTMKSNAVVPLAIFAFAIARAYLQKRITLRQLRSRPYRPAYIALLLGMLVNAGKTLYYTFVQKQDIAAMHFGGTAQLDTSWSHFLRFSISDFVQIPLPIRRGDSEFFGFFLQSWVFGGDIAYLNYLPWAGLINLFTLAFAVFLIVACVRMWRGHIRSDEVMLHQAAAVIAVAATIIFTLIKTHRACQSFKYILPMLASMVVLYAHALEYYRARGHRIGFWLGAFLGAGLPLLATLYYIAQYWGPE